ncbi:MAG: N-acetylneuraminate synthase family protein [Bdellovibrionales bacterium]|nr:N-acetylneuraminate synthase family protein [Bdellovibrionales bacterium]
MNQSPKELQIGSHTVGIGHSPLLIAEIGINHNGSLLKAKELILQAKECGVQVVKFQKRNLSAIYTEEVLNHIERFEQGFQYLIPILKDCELTEDEMTELKIFSDDLELTFICTPFDIESAQYLHSMNLKAYKVSSADLTNMPLIEELASYGKPILLSTGMSIDKEVQYTVDFLNSQSAEFILLHCVSSYPVDPQKANLERIRALASRFNALVGYSGHDLGTSLSLVATAFGACIIEKHFTMDRKLPGPDHKVSLIPEELQRLAARLREEVANGASLTVTTHKEKNDILQGELLNKQIFRKGLVAARDLSSGDTIHEEDISLKIPGGSLTGQQIQCLIGEKVPYPLKKDEAFPSSLLRPATDTESARLSLTPDSSWHGWSYWGFVVRYHDFHVALPDHPKVLEFHLTEHDTTLKIPTKALSAHRDQLSKCILRVHCCEYLSDRLFDLCSSSRDTRRRSFTMLQKVIDITHELAEYFSEAKPAVVFNCGAMTLQYDKRGVKIDEDELFTSILSLRTHGITLLAQNMPPYPWYYGGQWKGHFFLEPEQLIRFCKKTGHKICLDLSHASMASRYLNIPLLSYLLELKPYVRHMHVSDAKSIEGEGAQLGEGSINFQEVIQLFNDYPYTWIPEIWQGHLENNAGAKHALKAFSDLLRAHYAKDHQESIR